MKKSESFFSKQKKHYQRKDFSLDWSSGNVECSFDNSAKFSHANVREKKQENKLAIIYLSSKFACGNLECSSAYDADFLPVKFRFFSAKWPNLVFKYFFSIEKLLPKMFIWTHRKQFWQRCRNIFARIPEIFFTNVGTFAKTYFSLNFCSYSQKVRLDE